MNKTILSGRLTKDPELRFTPNGVAVATFTLAVNRKFKKEGQPDADFIQCVIWQKAAENTANFVGKGCRVNVVGRWETRSYDNQEGKRVYVNECIIDEIDFIDFKDGAQSGQTQGGGQQNNQQQQRSSQQSGGQQYRNNPDPFAGNNGQIDISDDDLPF